jgi:hypothetical protein
MRTDERTVCVWWCGFCLWHVCAVGGPAREKFSHQPGQQRSSKSRLFSCASWWLSYLAALQRNPARKHTYVCTYVPYLHQKQKNRQRPINSYHNMPSLDGIQRPTLDSIRQASSSTFDKAKLMVGLKDSSGGNTTDEESQQSERSMVDEAIDLLCPDLSFQQVRCCYYSYRSRSFKNYPY